MFMHRVSLAAAAAFMLLSINACSKDTGPMLAAPDAYAQTQSGMLTLIDIRRPDGWRQTGVAKGALRINMAHPQGAARFVQQVAAEMGGDKNAPIALICRTGTAPHRCSRRSAKRDLPGYSTSRKAWRAAVPVPAGSSADCRWKRVKLADWTD
jgi:rhodanese-related sulfurtransferase